MTAFNSTLQKQLPVLKLLLATAWLATNFSAGAVGITHVEFGGKTYTNIQDVYLRNDRIVILTTGGVTMAREDELPADFVTSWDIDKEIKKRIEAAIVSGFFREVDGVVYDIRKPESKWVTLKPKVLQINDDGAILDLTPDTSTALAIHVRHLPNTTGDTDTVRFFAKLIGSYSYINKLNDDRTIRDYDVGIICDRDKIPSAVLNGHKAFEALASTGSSSHKEMTASLPDSDDLKASGTGFFITDDGYFITNNHVVKGAAKVRIITRNGPLTAKVVQADEALDLALLKVEGKFVSLPIIPSRSVHLGESVITIGFPEIVSQGFAPKFAKGEIAGLSGIQDDPKYFQISVPVQHGNSGGALVNQRGDVVGVVAAKLGMSIKQARSSDELPENVNYAVKSSFLLSFLESVPQLTSKLKEPISGDQNQDEAVNSAEDASAMVLIY